MPGLYFSEQFKLESNPNCYLISTEAQSPSQTRSRRWAVGRGATTAPRGEMPRIRFRLGPAAAEGVAEGGG